MIGHPVSTILQDYPKREKTALPLARYNLTLSPTIPPQTTPAHGPAAAASGAAPCGSRTMIEIWATSPSRPLPGISRARSKRRASTSRKPSFSYTGRPRAVASRYVRRPSASAIASIGVRSAFAAPRRKYRGDVASRERPF